MLKIPFLLFPLGILLFFCACASHEKNESFMPTENDLLTQTEVNDTIFHARNFIANSKRLKIKNTERATIAKEEPEVNIVYTGCKTGKMILSWKLPHNRTLELITEGELLKKRPAWFIQIKTSSHGGAPEIRDKD